MQFLKSFNPRKSLYYDPPPPIPVFSSTQFQIELTNRQTQFYEEETIKVNNAKWTVLLYVLYSMETGVLNLLLRHETNGK